MRRIVLTTCLMLMSFCLFAAEPVYLSGVYIKPSPTASRFTFILSQKTYGSVKYIPQPDRVEIQLANTYNRVDMQNTKFNNANVKSIQLQDAQNGKLRFVLSVTGEARWDIQFLPGDNADGARLQVTIFTLKKTVKKIIKPIFVPRLPVLTKQNSLMTEVRNTIESLPSVKRLSKFTVVIDAGHGGKDSGALGARGTKEKDIVLSIAKKLANTINSQQNMRAILTRNGDYFVPLRGRLKLARKDKADLFVAIHADAYFEKDATGASVYALSQRGASNEAARWLAQRDNYSELGGVELDSLHDRDPILRSVLVDLAQTATIQDSMSLGNKVLSALDDMASLHHAQVERAPFVVLKSPDIPSILVETGFITNPREENRLADARYQEKLARALWRGIDQYLQKYALHDR